MAYLYETHLHTCQSSGCGVSTGAEHARFYKELGFQGIIVTDHFFGGNTCVPRDLPWKERVERFCIGYEDALAEGQKIGLDVFFGWERHYRDDEYLIYGLDKAWLLNHPEVEHWSRREQLENIHRYGGSVVQAHPFRLRSYMQHIRLGHLYCDGVEVANAGNQSYEDACAYRYAKAFGKTMTAGSDNHYSHADLDITKKIFGISLDHRMENIHDLVHMIRNKTPIGLNVPDTRWDLPADPPHMEPFFLDEQEQLVRTNRDWLRE